MGARRFSSAKVLGLAPGFFVTGKTLEIWNIPPRFCIIGLRSIALPSIALGQTHCFCPGSAPPNGPKPPWTCAPAAASWHWPGTDAGTAARVPAVELQPPASALLQAAVADQDIRHIQPVCADLRTFAQQPGQWDVCACNPPYFTQGPAADSPARALARHEESCGLEDVCSCGFRLLRDGGKLALCHRPERLAEVLAALRAARLEPKRLAFVKNTPDGAPWLFLVEAQKNRRTGLRVEPDVLICSGAARYGR